MSSIVKNLNDEENLADLNNQNKKLGKTARKTIKSEQSKLETIEATITSTDLRLRQTQLASISQRFYDVWSDYNQAQDEFRESSKKLLIKQCHVLGNTNLDDKVIESMLDQGNDSMFAKSILDQENLAKKNISELQSRHDEFIKVHLIF